MEDDWATVKAKPKKKVNKANQQEKKTYGGKTAGGQLIAGPIKQGNQQDARKDYGALNNQASAIADFDYHIDDDYYAETAVETVSHACAQAVSAARTNKKMT